ncbi:MAG: GNAT family N-acetyltransferase [Thiobacillus sp.]|nr:GNAT family N-acetyltransferase [Thiobacillus sp.]
MFAIEPATRQDLSYLHRAMAALLAHVRDTSQDAYLLRLTDRYIEDSVDWLARLMASDESIVLVAKRGGEPVGYAIGSLTRPFIERSAIETIGLIEHCWVEPACRRQALATKLVEALERWFSERSVEFVDVQYLLGNSEAEATWVRLGYRPYRVIARKQL